MTASSLWIKTSLEQSQVLSHSCAHAVVGATLGVTTSVSHAMRCGEDCVGGGLVLMAVDVLGRREKEMSAMAFKCHVLR